MVVDKTKLAVALLILGLSIGTCIGYGVLRIPQPRLAFDLMMLLTFVWMLIWTIKKRHARARDAMFSVYRSSVGALRFCEPT